MNYWSALEVLGLEDEDELTRDRVRRKYMRLLREHPPEKDPEGFRQLREAFEAVRDVVPEFIERDDEDDDEGEDEAQPAPAQIFINEAKAEDSPSRSGSRIIVSAAPNAATPADAKHSGQWRSDGGYALSTPIREELHTKRAAANENAEDADTDDTGGGGYSLSNPIREEIHSRKAVHDTDDDDNDTDDEDDVDAEHDEDDNEGEGAYSLSTPIREEIGGRASGSAADDDDDDDDDADDYDDDDSDEDDADADADAEDDDAADYAADSEDPLDSNNPLPLQQLVDKVLILLEHDEVEHALALEARWRDHSDSDDHRLASDFTAVRWALTRELLAVATSLPSQVVSALARGISVHDVQVARSDLEAFRRRDPEKAAEANVVLAKRAPDLYKQIAGTLYVAPAREYFVPPPSVSSSSSSGNGLNAVWVILGILVLIIKIAARDSSHSSRYTPDVHIDTSYLRDLNNRPQIDYEEIAKLSRPRAPEPLPDPDDKATATWQISDSLNVLQQTYPEISSSEQRIAALLMDSELRTEDCRRIRKAFAKLEAAPPSSSAQQVYGEDHITAIEQRIEIICPPPKVTKPKKRTKPKTPPPPTATETEPEPSR